MTLDDLQSIASALDDAIVDFSAGAQERGLAMLATIRQLVRRRYLAAVQAEIERTDRC